MLYERWREVVRTHRHELALREVGSERKWTFEQLAQSAEEEASSIGKFCHPAGSTAEFIQEVLRGWRDGTVVFPVETGIPATLPDRLPPDCVHVKCTSATTGVPKLVAFTAGQLAADAENIVTTMGLRPDWPNLGVISMAHSYGFSNLVLPLLLHGIPLHLVGSTLPEAVRQASGSLQDVCLPGVPALWRAWHESGALPSNIRLAISAGAPLPADLELAVHEETGLKIHNFYGSTECGGIAYDAETAPRQDAACVGTPMKNVRVSVGEGGLLEVRGNAVGLACWPDPDGRLSEGCFRTGDLAEIKEGRVFLRGRLGDQINVAGRKVSPESIEIVLRSHPSVRECLVLGIPSSGSVRGETIVACVGLSQQVDENVLRKFLQEQLPAWQVPREWWFVDALRPNRRGKLSRSEWRERYLESRGRGD